MSNRMASSSRGMALACFLSAVASAAHAQTSPIDQDIIEQRQRSLLDDARRQRESLQRSIEINPEATPMEAPEGAPCFTIQRFEWRGVDHLPESRRREWSDPLQGQCLSVAQMLELARVASNEYIAQGFVTSRVIVPEQDVSDGALELLAQEGRIEAISLDGERSANLAALFPGLVGAVLNLRDIEQGMEQINRLPSQQVTIDIQPGTRPGHSIIELHRVERRKPGRLDLGMDNSGQESTGETQAWIGLALDAPLGWFDQWTLDAGHDTDLATSRRSRNVSLGTSLPYGYWTFGYGYAWNDYFQDIHLGQGNWRYRGVSQSHRVQLGRVLYRDGRQKLGISAALSRRDTKTSLAGQRLEVSSPTLTTLSLGMSYATTWAGGYLTLSPGVSQGIDALGATGARQPGMPSVTARKATLSASFFRPLAPRLDYFTSLYGQATADDLYPSERIAIGGEYSVRGFKAQYLTGNRGAYWRHQLDWTAQPLPVLGVPTFTLAMDGGWIERETERGEGGSLLGTAVSLSLHGTRLRQSLTLGKPLMHPHGMAVDPWVSYWQLALRL